MKKTLLIFSLWLCVLSAAQAQQKNTLALLSKSTPNAILLRWAPQDPAVWQWGNRHGYRIERFTLLENGQLQEKEGKQLNSSPIRPYEAERLLQIADTLEEAGMLYELLYGEKVDISSGQGAGLLQQREDMENRHGLTLLIGDLHPGIAALAGLFWEDTDIEAGKRYVYRVSLATAMPETVTEPAVHLVDPAETRELKAPERLRGKFSDQTATLQWPVRWHQGVYNAYWLERSENNRDFIRVTDFPIIPMSEKSTVRYAHYIDSLPNNHQTYYYRLRGITPFGETGPASKVVQGQGEEEISGLLVIEETRILQEQEKSRITVSWRFPNEYKGQLSGFEVWRAAKSSGPYAKITASRLSVSVSEFTDTQPMASNYYKVVALDGEGRERVASFPYFAQLEDSTPPAAPQGLKGFVDSLGVVRLEWAGNPEGDVQGYRIFRGDSKMQEPMEVSRDIVPETAYREQLELKTLLSKVYYRVAAVDRSYNVSEFSEALVLERPDKVAPVPPVIYKTEEKDGEITLSWKNSLSRDVVYYGLHRMEQGRDGSVQHFLVDQWELATPEEGTIIAEDTVLTTYTDQVREAGVHCWYELRATDRSGNIATGVSRKVYVASLSKPTVQRFRAVPDGEVKKVTLQWEFSHREVQKCFLYRAVNGGRLQLYQTLGNQTSFEDQRVKSGTAYEYQVRYVTAEGEASEWSEKLEIK